MQTMKIEAVRGDITRQDVDAIVNVANSALVPGGGVCGAIHRGAGPAVEGECRQIRRTIYPEGLPVGGAVATGAGMLPARWIIHTVWPNALRGETDPCLLAQSFVSSLREALDLGARSVAFPASTAGGSGWDVHDVARIAVDAVRDFADRGGAGSIGLVRFVPFDAGALQAFSSALARPAAAAYRS
jgi:O-acetyl-ADP-ribose deacetylase (regulator of RNase III)